MDTYNYIIDGEEFTQVRLTKTAVLRINNTLCQLKAQHGTLDAIYEATQQRYSSPNTFTLWLDSFGQAQSIVSGQSLADIANSLTQDALIEEFHHKAPLIAKALRRIAWAVLAYNSNL